MVLECVCSGALFSIQCESSDLSEGLMSSCVACVLCVEEFRGVLSNSTVQQSKQHSRFHTILSGFDSLKASAQITLVMISLHIVGLVPCFCVCLCLGEVKD